MKINRQNRSDSQKRYYLCTRFQGKMPEWSNGPHSKCGVRVTVPGVRIPLFPPKGCRKVVTAFFISCPRNSGPAVPERNAPDSTKPMRRNPTCDRQPHRNQGIRRILRFAPSPAKHLPNARFTRNAPRGFPRRDRKIAPYAPSSVSRVPWDRNHNGQRTTDNEHRTSRLFDAV